MADYTAHPHLYDVRHAHLTADVQFYVGEARTVGGRILELGCGTGRVTLAVALAGERITGLDISSEMLTLAEGKCKELQAPVQSLASFHVGDMRSFALSEAFDLAILPFRSFMHLETADEQLQALRCIREHLRPSGRLVLDVKDPDLIGIALRMGPLGDALIATGEEFVDPTSGHVVQVWESCRYNLHQQTIQRITVFEELDISGTCVRRFQTTTRQRWIYRYEMEHLLCRAGFVVTDLFGDFQRGPFTRPGQEQVWIAERD